MAWEHGTYLARGYCWEMAGDDPNDPTPEYPGIDPPFEVPEEFGTPSTAFPPPGQGAPGGAFPPPGSANPPSQFPPPGQTPPPGVSPPPGQVPPAQPAAYPPPSGYAAPAGAPVFTKPEKKKGLGCLGWGLIVSALLVVLAGGCGFLIFQASKGPTEAANNFLSSIEAGDYTGAASQASNDTGCSVSADTIAADFPGLSSYTVFGFGAGGDGGVGGEVTLADGSTGFAMELVEEDGEWKPCTYEVGDNVSVEVGNS